RPTTHDGAAGTRLLRVRDEERPELDGLEAGRELAVLPGAGDLLRVDVLAVQLEAHRPDDRVEIPGIEAEVRQRIGGRARPAHEPPATGPGASSVTAACRRKARSRKRSR